MLENIINAYKKSHKFCELMQDYQDNNINYDDAISRNEFLELEHWREQSMQKSQAITILGSLLYFSRHPIKMITAQKYYNSSFGKPCKI